MRVWRKRRLLCKQVILSAAACSLRFQGASGTVYKAVYDPSLALSGRGDADEDDLGLSVVRSTCSVAVKKMKVGADSLQNAYAATLKPLRRYRRPPTC